MELPEAFTHWGFKSSFFKSTYSVLEFKRVQITTDLSPAQSYKSVKLIFFFSLSLSIPIHAHFEALGSNFSETTKEGSHCIVIFISPFDMGILAFRELCSKTHMLAKVLGPMRPRARLLTISAIS